MDGDEEGKFGDSSVHLLHIQLDTGNDETERSETLRSEAHTLEDDNEAKWRKGVNTVPEIDVLKANRIKRFTSPHQLDRTKVDVDLERQFITHLMEDDVDCALSLMRANVTNQKLLLTSCALSAAIQVGDLGLVKAMILYPMVDFSNKSRAPVCEAVMKQEAKLVELLLLSPITDVNKGCPLARAVELNDLTLIKTLLASDRINPNKGGALYRAVGMGNIKMIEALLGHKRLNVNKFCGGVGSTPLCRAIDLQAESMVKLLVQHPKIDINKGFLLTPLQHAVDAQAPEIVRILIEAPAAVPLDPNKRMGGTASPLLLALKGKFNKEIVRLLLSCNTTDIDDEVLEVIEKRGLHEVEDMILRSNRRVPFSAFWCSKVLCSVVGTFFICAANILLLKYLEELVIDGAHPQIVLSMLTLCIGNTGSYILLKKDPQMLYKRRLKLRLFPICYDVYLCTLLLQSVFAASPLTRRTEMYPSGQVNYKYQVLLVSGPMACVQLIMFVIEQADGGKEGGGLVKSVIGMNILAVVKLIVTTLLKQYQSKRMEDTEQAVGSPHGSVPIILNPIDMTVAPHSYLSTPDGTTERQPPAQRNAPSASLSERRQHCPPEYVHSSSTIIQQTRLEPHQDPSYPHSPAPPHENSCREVKAEHKWLYPSSFVTLIVVAPLW